MTQTTGLAICALIAEIKFDVIELKLDRLIEEMRFLKSRTIAFDTRLRAIEAYLKLSEPSEQQPDSKFTPWLAAAASATARTALFAIGAAVGVTLTTLIWEHDQTTVGPTAGERLRGAQEERALSGQPGHADVGPGWLQ